MFWNKNDKSTLPELPPISSDIGKSLDKSKEDENSFEIDSHPLPSFPDSPMSKGFSQSAIKNAVEVPEESDAEEDSQKLEMPKATIPITVPLTSSIAYTPSIHGDYTPTSLNFSKAKQETGNVFVKIDKFNSARKALGAAQQKIEEIDRMLKKIREARMREEQELSAWEKEVENAKTRIEEASKDLFDKLS